MTKWLRDAISDSPYGFNLLSPHIQYNTHVCEGDVSLWAKRVEELLVTPDGGLLIPGRWVAQPSCVCVCVFSLGFAACLHAPTGLIC